MDNTDHGVALTERFDRGFTACDPDGDNALDLDEFRSFVLTVAPDAALKVELVLSKVRSSQVKSGQVKSGQVKPSRVQSSPVESSGAPFD